ncbi:MAG TPA: glucose-6-phosphate isomerase, partial [Pseudonocardiaceae bacterium]
MIGLGDPTGTPEWAALAKHHDRIKDLHLRELFAADPNRAASLRVHAGDLLVDYSKHRVTEETIQLLVVLAARAGLIQRREAMFRGDHINTTEDRAVLHVALRMPPQERLVADGQDVVGDVHAVLTQMSGLAERIRSGAWTGHTGRRIRTVVNIGIGGSDLGPAMAYQALADYATPQLSCRFVSN